jgi:hypothetical protein
MFTRLDTIKRSGGNIGEHEMLIAVNFDQRIAGTNRAHARIIEVAKNDFKGTSRSNVVSMSATMTISPTAAPIARSMNFFACNSEEARALA